MNQMPHLDANGNAFFNGTHWSQVTQHHWNDGIPSWVFDVAIVLAAVGGLIGLTLFFAQV